MITPNDHISHDLSYICGPRTSGAAKIEEEGYVKKVSSGMHTVRINLTTCARTVYSIYFRHTLNFVCILTGRNTDNIKSEIYRSDLPT